MSKLNSTSSDATGVIGAPGSELRPGKMSVMSSDLGDLFLVALDTPVCSNVISIDEALLVLVGLGVGEPCGKGAHNQLPRDIHIY